MKKTLAVIFTVGSLLISAGFAYDSYCIRTRLAQVESKQSVSDSIQIMLLDETHQIRYSLEEFGLEILVDPNWPVDSCIKFQAGPELELN